MNEHKSGSINQHHYLMLLLSIMQIILLLQDNAIFLLLKSLKEQFVFHNLCCLLKFRQNIHFFSFGIEHIKRNYWIIFLKLVPVIFSWWMIYAFPIVFITKGLVFDIPNSSPFFMIECNCCSALKAFVIIITRIYCWFFLSNQENIYMIHHLSDLFYDLFNIRNQHYQNKITPFHWFFLAYFISIKNWFKIFFNNFICFIINHDFSVTSVFRRNKVNF